MIDDEKTKVKKIKKLTAAARDGFITFFYHDAVRVVKIENVNGTSQLDTNKIPHDFIVFGEEVYRDLPTKPQKKTFKLSKMSNLVPMSKSTLVDFIG